MVNMKDFPTCSESTISCHLTLSRNTFCFSFLTLKITIMKNDHFPNTVVMMV